MTTRFRAKENAASGFQLPLAAWSARWRGPQLAFSCTKTRPYTEDQTSLVNVLIAVLVLELQIVVFVLIREIRTLQIHREVGRDVVAHRGVYVVSRFLVERQPFRAPDLVERHRPLAAVVVSQARLELFTLIPEGEIRLVDRIILERDSIPA